QTAAPQYAGCGQSRVRRSRPPREGGRRSGVLPAGHRRLTMPAEVRTSPFDPYEELRRYQERLPGGRAAAGATASFVGTMRDFNDGESVRAMTLEHYPGMTEKHLERIVAEARERWPIIDALVVHRVGPLAPGDPIVLVAVWSAHRDAAFA